MKTSDSPDVKVWDRFVRIAHWSLLVLFTFSYFTGEDNTGQHVWSGYAIALLVVARILWGFVGSEHARFAAFIRSPRAAWAYLKGLRSGSAPATLGHNAAGGWMILALLGGLLSTTLSGMTLYGLEGRGPLAAWACHSPLLLGTPSPAIGAGLATGPRLGIEENHEDHNEEHDEHDDSGGPGCAALNSPYAEDVIEEAEHQIEEIHETFINVMLGLIVLHVLGVLASSRAHHENLIRAMWTGTKKRPV